MLAPRVQDEFQIADERLLCVGTRVTHEVKRNRCVEIEIGHVVYPAPLVSNA